jgi:ribokinase
MIVPGWNACAPGGVVVVGPAYLDRVLRIANSLRGGDSAPIDLSVEGQLEGVADSVTGELELVDAAGSRIVVAMPRDWPGPWGRIRLLRELGPVECAGGDARQVAATDWEDDLGGMGAGYAQALGGILVHALGEETDAISGRISAMLDAAGIRERRVIRIPGVCADWTLLVTSGRHGDKLPIGFRGCHSAIPAQTLRGVIPECSVLVVTSLPNALAGVAFDAQAEIRLFAPAVRNMADREVPIRTFADRIDVLACNRHEWEMLDPASREAIMRNASLRVLTEGAQGSRIWLGWKDSETGRVMSGTVLEHVEPAFPRSEPPRDTNRAGECYLATLLSVLLREGWRPRVRGSMNSTGLSRAARLASCAAALVLDQERFGFPTWEEITDAEQRGQVGSSMRS